MPTPSATLAVFTKNTTNPAYAAFRLAADRAASGAGARTVHYVPEKPDDVGEQTAMVHAIVRDRPDAILFVPVDDVAMVGPVERINAAGIPIVLCINRMAGRFVTFVGSDDVEVGYLQARALCRHLGGRGQVVIIEGVPAAPTSRDRLRGTQRALAEFPDVSLLASGPGNYQRPDAKRLMTRFLSEHPRIDGVIAANDVMALGAIEALREAGRRAPVVGVNAIPEAVEAIEAGTLLASVDFSAFNIAAIAAQAALRHLGGLPVPPTIMLPTTLVERTNAKAQLTPFDQRACPRWDDVMR